MCAVLAAAPLAAGGVHRLPILALLLASALGLALLAAGAFIDGRALRVGLVALVPALFVLIPAWQSLPLPRALRASIDREGSSLLDDNPAVAGRAWPLSLDPPSTRVQVGRAAAGLAIFLVAFHLASGHRRRHILPRLIGATGIAAVAIGLGHRIFGVTKIYGLFTPSRALLNGPFVNNNHNAAFLEIAAFACLACSFQKATALNRVGWMVGTVLCAAGAVGTLSRGAALALATGSLLFLFLRHLARDAGSVSRRRSSLAWALFLLGLLVLAAGALGAGQLIDRFQRSAVTTDIRLKLWWDSLRVFAAHPLGIGRGAFARVYPVYRTLLTPFPLRFSFVENEPLQLLIECGWLLYLGILAGMAFLVRSIVKHGRRDLIEAAFVSGLFAVITHSFLDFGLETLGVLLPFMAMLGLVLGRSRAAESALLARRPGWLMVGTALGGLLFGAAAVAHPSSDDFDVLLRNTPRADKRRELLARAQAAHPTDYFYVLAFARTEPLRPVTGGVSPRLHALNRALRLCPSCELAHMEVGRNLWALSYRPQALVEWREAVRLQPAFFEPTLGELTAAGAKPEELAAIATFDARRMIDVATFLTGLNRLGAAFTVLDQADALGAPRAESLLARGRLQLQAGRVEAAQTTIAEGHAAGIQDPRLILLDAQVTLLTKGVSGADQVLAILDAGATRYPQDLPIQRLRVDTVMKYEKWQAAERSIDGLKMALYGTYGSAGESHVAAARIQSRLGRWNNALGEYRIALADAPDDVALWIELGKAAEKAGRDAVAREALAEAARLSPSNPEVQTELRQVDQRQARMRGVMDSLGGSVKDHQ